MPNRVSRARIAETSGSGIPVASTRSCTVSVPSSSDRTNASRTSSGAPTTRWRSTSLGFDESDASCVATTDVAPTSSTRRGRRDDRWALYLAADEGDAWSRSGDGASARTGTDE